jgi:hypothetical protein
MRNRIVIIALLMLTALAYILTGITLTTDLAKVIPPAAVTDTLEPIDLPKPTYALAPSETPEPSATVWPLTGIRMRLGGKGGSISF